MPDEIVTDPAILKRLPGDLRDAWTFLCANCAGHDRRRLGEDVAAQLDSVWRTVMEWKRDLVVMYNLLVLSDADGGIFIPATRAEAIRAIQVIRARGEKLMELVSAAQRAMDRTRFEGGKVVITDEPLPVRHTTLFDTSKSVQDRMP